MASENESERKSRSGRWLLDEIRRTRNNMSARLCGENYNATVRRGRETDDALTKNLFESTESWKLIQRVTNSCVICCGCLEDRICCISCISVDPIWWKNIGRSVQ